MKMNRSILVALVLLIVVAAVYRIIPSRPLGFMPHMAMALFGGAMIKDRKWAFALPIFSIFLSDLLYETLFRAGLSDIPGFYAGQFTNYLLFAGLTLIGMAIRSVNLLSVATASLVAPTLYFLVSNFFVWLNGGGWGHPKTMDGLMATYTDGLPFYRGNLLSTILFSALLFGLYLWLRAPKTDLAGRKA